MLYITTYKIRREHTVKYSLWSGTHNAIGLLLHYRGSHHTHHLHPKLLLSSGHCFLSLRLLEHL